MQFSLCELIDSFFSPSPQKKYRWISWIWLGLLFLGGLFLYGYFLNWGRGPFTFHDWALVTGPRLAFLKDSVEKGVLPLHISNNLTLGTITDRFMTVPDMLLSPQIFLLKFMDIGPFVLVNTWLAYAAGFGGMIWLQKKHQLSTFVFTLLFLLFNFNGNILAHFTVGHATWTGYFLYIWFIGLLLDLIQGKGNWKWVAKVSILLFVILLQGSYHQYVWGLMCLGVLAVVLPKHFWTLIKAGLFSGLIAMIRLLPPVLNLGKFDNVYIGGYPLFQSIWDSLIYIQIPNDITISNGMTRPIGLWEYTTYIGILAAIFLIGFGIFRVVTRANQADSYSTLLFPAAVLVVLSLGKFYQYLRIAVPFPLIEGERVASRIASLAFVILLILAVIEFQRWLDAWKFSAGVTLTFAAGLVLIANDIWQNFRFWRIVDAYDKFEVKEFIPAQWMVANHPDPQYFNILWLGLVISVISLGAVLFFAWKEDRRRSI
jgi:hypothetical protein